MQYLKQVIKKIPLAERSLKWIYFKLNIEWEKKIFSLIAIGLGPSMAGRLRQFYVWVSGKQKLDMQFWIESIMKNDEAFIVQIGSNDGKSNDPLNNLILRRKKWRALFVEPVPYLFDQLKKAYPKDRDFLFENVAINKGERLPFYWLDQSAKKNIPSLPAWYSQLGSFNRQHIIKHFGYAIEPYIITTDIEGISLQTLFSRNNLQKIDVLQIDTEGYDWEILSQLDLKSIVPVLIIFEHFHLSPATKQQAIEFLKGQYIIIEFKMDFLCVDRKENILSVQQLNALIDLSIKA
jgi:FkbM family methyltransferase